MVKLKQLFNHTINKTNNQESLDIKKRMFKELNLNIEDILDIEIHRKELKKKW